MTDSNLTEDQIPDGERDADDTQGIDHVSLEDLERTGRTRVFEGEPRTVRLALPAGETVPAHTHPGRDIVLHLVEGAVDVTVGGTARSLSGGDVIRFDGRHEVSLTATDDSEALLVLAPQF
ncbi:cupin domain-containing protein [Halomicroarcula sp. GCM10025817]|uniref:cupin domain-containing protein n=1 Tax=Haloarcula TaxID=2237 RepID=UPI0023E896AE|nr:cupin domain-containing protein [Halomicroarcula sp. SYNS111]